MWDLADGVTQEWLYFSRVPALDAEKGMLHCLSPANMGLCECICMN